jgi:hypothetical protein
MTVDKHFREREDAIVGEMSDIGFDIIEKTSNLALVDWDSPTVKAQIKEMLDHYWKLHDELDLLEK